MDIKRLSKIDLHCHLDGSLAFEMLQKHLKRNITRDMVQIDDDCKSLTEYLKKFDLPLECLQDEKGLEDGAYSFIKEVAKDHIKYVEVRFAPILSVNDSLSCGRVIASVLQGLKRGKEDYQVDYNVITCAMCHHTPDRNEKMLHTAREFLGNGVCAIDLAGDESRYPTVLFRDLFAEARRIGMPFVIHSGETGNIENVRTAYEFGAVRIGHGIALQKDKELMKLYAKKGIGVEMCPTSNFQTNAVRSWEEYPLMEYLDAGIKVSINTDNRTVSNTTMTKELEKIYHQYGQDEELIMRLLDNAVDTAFQKDIRL